MDIVAYTDGSCNNKTRIGGLGAVILIDDKPIHQISIGSYKNTTSARMEIMAVIEVLILIKKTYQNINSIVVYSDNQYVVKSWSLRWVHRWEYHNWGDRINQDLWKEFVWLTRQLQEKVELRWVKGHNGDLYNEVADELAELGRQSEKVLIDLI